MLRGETQASHIRRQSQHATQVDSTGEIPAGKITYAVRYQASGADTLHDDMTMRYDDDEAFRRGRRPTSGEGSVPLVIATMLQEEGSTGLLCRCVLGQRRRRRCRLSPNRLGQVRKPEPGPGRLIDAI
jgi:hypothetical protein